MTAVPSVRLDTRKYSRLLAKAQPRAITSEEENDRMLALIDQLMSKGEENVTPEESAEGSDLRSAQWQACDQQEQGEGSG